jgi:hypothetical protein
VNDDDDDLFKTELYNQKIKVLYHTELPLTGSCCSSDSIEIGFNFMFRSVAAVPATDDDGEDALKDAGWGAVTSALQCMRQWFRGRLLSCM